MFRGNPSLGMITREDRTRCRARQPLEARCDFIHVPERTVLLFEQQQPSGAILSRRHPRDV